MKNPIYMMIASMIVGTAAMHFGTPSTTQDAAIVPSPAATPSAPVLLRHRNDDGELIESTVRDGVILTRTNLGSPVRTLADGLKDASPEEKKELEAKIREELEKQYDDFLANNEKQIEKFQERIDRLKDQLDRRRRAKSKLVDLEFERILNVSEGLIWPDSRRSPWSYEREGIYYAPSAPSPADPFAGTDDPFAESPNFRSMNIRPKRPLSPGQSR